MVEAQGNRSVPRQFAWLSAGRIVAALIQALLMVLLARAVMPAEFGIVGVALGVAAVLRAALDLGLTTFIVRERAAESDNGVVTDALRLSNGISWFVVLGITVALVIMGMFASPVFLLLAPLGLWIGGERIADAHLALALADGDTHLNVTNLVARRVSSLVLYIGMAALGINPILAYSIGVGAAALGSALLTYTYMGKRLAPRANEPPGKILASSRAYWVHTLMIQLRELDAAITGAIAGSAAAGFYSAGARLTSPLRILPTSMGTVLMPAVARARKLGTGLRRVMRAAAVMSIGMTAVYLALAWVAPFIVPIVLGPDYEPSIFVIQVIILGLPFAGVVSLLTAILQGLGHKRQVASVSSGFTLLCLASVAVGATLWGALGAASALSISFLAHSLTLGFLLLHIRKV